jgi:hypothetical protein
VHEIADHLADRHPLDAAAGETYLPAVALRVSASEGNLEIVTTRDLGYASDASKGDSGQPSPRAGAPDWKFSIRVEAEVNVADDLDPFGIGVDHRYLSDALEVLAGPIELRMTTPREPLCLVTLEGSARQVVIMPLAPPSA